METKPLISYIQIIPSSFGDKRYLNLFENGIVTTLEDNYLLKGKIVSKNIGKEKVQSYANKLMELGFQNCDSNYSDLGIRDGILEELTLNYNGVNKTVKFENNRCSEQLNNFINEISDLLKN